MFRDREPSQQHSYFGPTSLSCALINSVSDCEKGRFAGLMILLISNFAFLGIPVAEEETLRTEERLHFVKDYMTYLRT